jgi:hypothetical protein
VPILAALTVLFFITTVIFGLMALAPNTAPIKTGNVQRAAQVANDDEIIDVASRFTKNLMTYNHRTVRADVERVLRDATREFGSRPQGALGGDITNYREQIEEAEGTSNAEVKSVALTSRDDDTATVIVTANRTFDSNQRENPARILQVVELTLLSTSDGWKVDNAANPATAS